MSGCGSWDPHFCIIRWTPLLEEFHRVRFTPCPTHTEPFVPALVRCTRPDIRIQTGQGRAVHSVRQRSKRHTLYINAMGLPASEKLFRTGLLFSFFGNGRRQLHRALAALWGAALSGSLAEVLSITYRLGSDAAGPMAHGQGRPHLKGF